MKETLSQLRNNFNSLRGAESAFLLSGANCSGFQNSKKLTSLLQRSYSRFYDSDLFKNNRLIKNAKNVKQINKKKHSVTGVKFQPQRAISSSSSFDLRYLSPMYKLKYEIELYDTRSRYGLDALAKEENQRDNDNNRFFRKKDIETYGYKRSLRFLSSQQGYRSMNKSISYGKFRSNLFNKKKFHIIHDIHRNIYNMLGSFSCKNGDIHLNNNNNNITLIKKEGKENNKNSNSKNNIKDNEKKTNNTNSSNKEIKIIDFSKYNKINNLHNNNYKINNFFAHSTNHKQSCSSEGGGGGGKINNTNRNYFTNNSNTPIYSSKTKRILTTKSTLSRTLSGGKRRKSSASIQTRNVNNNSCSNNGGLFDNTTYISNINNNTYNNFISFTNFNNYYGERRMRNKKFIKHILEEVEKGNEASKELIKDIHNSKQYDQLSLFAIKDHKKIKKLKKSASEEIKRKNIYKSRYNFKYHIKSKSDDNSIENKYIYSNGGQKKKKKDDEEEIIIDPYKRIRERFEKNGQFLDEKSKNIFRKIMGQIQREDKMLHKEYNSKYFRLEHHDYFMRLKNEFNTIGMDILKIKKKYKGDGAIVPEDEFNCIKKMIKENMINNMQEETHLEQLRRRRNVGIGLTPKNKYYVRKNFRNKFGVWCSC